MAKHLKNLRIFTIGSVDHPCNQAAKVALVKRHDPDINRSKGKEEFIVPFSEEVLKSLPGTVQAEILKLQQQADLAAQLTTQVQQLTTDNGNLTKRVKELEDANEVLEKKLNPPSEEELLKSLPESLRKMFEDAKKIADDAQAVAKAEKDARLNAEFISKAKELNSLTVDPEAFGPLLKRASEVMAAADFEALMQVFKAADAQLKEAGLFKEHGRNSDGGGGDVLKRAQALADELKKNNPTLTIEQALTKVWEQNPDLYSQYSSKSTRSYEDE